MSFKHSHENFWYLHFTLPIGSHIPATTQYLLSRQYEKPAHSLQIKKTIVQYPIIKELNAHAAEN